MEFLSISQVQDLINDKPECFVEEVESEAEATETEEGEAMEAEEEEEMPSLIGQEVQTTADPMTYIDHMFMVCGFLRLVEKSTITQNNISRLYCSPSGLCVSLKCGMSYKCSFLYDNKINYIYPATIELLDYVSQDDDDIGFNESYKLINPQKILPETFEIIVFKENSKPLHEHTVKMFEEKFLNCTNSSVSASKSTIIMTYVPVCSTPRKIAVEDFIKFLTPSW